MITRYLTGFSLSFLLTLLSFGVVWFHQQTGHELPVHAYVVVAVIAAALAQLMVQFVYFLEIGKKSGAWRLVTLSLTLVVAAIVLGGSLWIMATLGHAAPSERFRGIPSPQTQVD